MLTFIVLSVNLGITDRAASFKLSAKYYIDYNIRWSGCFQRSEKKLDVICWSFFEKSYLCMCRYLISRMVFHLCLSILSIRKIVTCNLLEFCVYFCDFWTIRTKPRILEYSSIQVTLYTCAVFEVM